MIDAINRLVAKGAAVANADEFFVPTREQVESLKVGDLALGCFGESRVTRIFGAGDDIKGRAYVCFYVENGPGSEISGSYKEGELVATMALCAKYGRPSDVARAIGVKCD